MRLNSIINNAKTPFLWSLTENASSTEQFYSDLAETIDVRNTDTLLPYLSVPRKVYLLKKKIRTIDEINEKNTSLFPSAYRVIHPSHTEAVIIHANEENKPEVYVMRVSEKDSLIKRATLQEIFTTLQVNQVFVRDFIAGLVQVKPYNNHYLS